MLLLTLSGLLAFAIMIPLFITSFTKVRKRMKGGKWKKLQRWAYPFYALVYVHMIASSIHETSMNVDKISLYTVIFGTYLVLKLGQFKAQKRKKRK